MLNDDTGAFGGSRLHPRLPRSLTLCFVDDTMLFCEATPTAARSETYSRALCEGVGADD